MILDPDRYHPLSISDRRNLIYDILFVFVHIFYRDCLSVANKDNCFRKKFVEVRPGNKVIVKITLPCMYDHYSIMKLHKIESQYITLF